MMDSKTIEYGLKALKNDFVAEALIHPWEYLEKIADNHSVEFSITQDMDLKDKLQNMNIEIVSHSF